MPATRRLILIIIILLLLILFLVVPGVSWSQTPPPNPWQEPAREFSRKVVALTGPRQTVALSVRNISSLSDSEVAAVRLALEAELPAAGLRLITVPNGGPGLFITLSENSQGFLWIAEILRDGVHEVTMISLQKTAATVPTASTAIYVLQSKLVFEQDGPILAFAELDQETPGAAPRLLVLDPAQLSLFQFVNERWTLLESVPVPKSPFTSRDTRSSMLSSGSSFSVLLSGTFCSGKTKPALNLQCSSSEKSFSEPVESYVSALKLFIVPGKNYFKHNIRDGRGQILREAQYYSGTVLREGEAVRQVFSNLDGTASLYAAIASPTPTATFSGWGSELQGIHSFCGRGSQLLVTRAGDWTEPDAVQAFEVVGARTNAVSFPLSLPGPVMELLRSNAPQSAGAVVRNLTTGRYEAYTLTLSCGR